MKTLTRMKSIGVVSTLVLAVSCVYADNPQVPISGRVTGSYTKQEAMPVMDEEGHVMLSGEFHGTNRNTGTTDYFGDAEVINNEMADLYRGNGHQHGYFTMKKGQDSAIAKWNGNVTTVMDDEQPKTSFAGKWEYISGSGQYVGIQGSGSYEGYFTSETEYTTNWMGTYK